MERLRPGRLVDAGFGGSTVRPTIFSSSLTFSLPTVLFLVSLSPRCVPGVGRERGRRQAGPGLERASDGTSE